MSSGLYIHVPFCLRKCAYCTFYSRTPGEGEVALYLRSLQKELRQLPEDFAPVSIFLGGGTPSALGSEGMRKLLAVLAEHVDQQYVSEFTCEVNPGVFEAQLPEVMKAGGINRVSLGAQSFSAHFLNLLGRLHSPDDIGQAVTAFRAAGLNNISLDLMIGLPGQRVAEAAEDVAAALALQPDHLSSYCLSIEPGTPLAAALQRHDMPPPDDGLQRETYDEVRRLLHDAGLAQYEISNWARPGRKSLHYTLYWQGWKGDTYLGCGPAAHSFDGRQRWSNPDSLTAWATALKEDAPIRQYDEELDRERRARELLVMGLRLREGVDAAEFERLQGLSLADLYGTTVDRLLEEHLLVSHNGSLILPEHALFISDSVFCELI